MESVKETNTHSALHNEPMYTCKHWNDIHVSQFTWFFGTKGKWTTVIREIVKSDLLTYRNTTGVPGDLIILMVFCSISPFTASDQHIRHEHRSLTYLFMHFPLPFSVYCFLSVPALGTFHFGYVNITQGNIHYWKSLANVRILVWHYLWKNCDLMDLHQIFHGFA